MNTKKIPPKIFSYTYQKYSQYMLNFPGIFLIYDHNFNQTFIKAFRISANFFFLKYSKINPIFFRNFKVSLNLKKQEEPKFSKIQ